MLSSSSFSRRQILWFKGLALDGRNFIVSLESQVFQRFTDVAVEMLQKQDSIITTVSWSLFIILGRFLRSLLKVCRILQLISVSHVRIGY